MPLGYTADGDAAMAMCEVLNTSAFSTNTTETETGRSTYEGACKKALEAGYHVAFTTDQDNHCANWGASYTNRTGVLIPTGTALHQRQLHRRHQGAPRVRDHGQGLAADPPSKGTANGGEHMMGERITNSGSLTLAANYANSTGKIGLDAWLFYEGVPGRNGTVTLLATGAIASHHPRPWRAFLLRQSDPERRQHPVVGADLGDPGGGRRRH